MLDSLLRDDMSDAILHVLPCGFRFHLRKPRGSVRRLVDPKAEVRLGWWPVLVRHC